MPPFTVRSALASQGRLNREGTPWPYICLTKQFGKQRGRERVIKSLLDQLKNDLHSLDIPAGDAGRNRQFGSTGLLALED